MKAWWQQLNRREQQLFLSMSVVIIIFLFYSLIWQPLNDNIIDGRKKLARQQALLSWVNTETQRYQLAKGTNALNGSKASISTVVNRTASAKGINITRIQPQGDNLQVWIDNIAFEQLLQWLSQLSQNEGIVVGAIDLSRADLDGEVRVKRLQLGRNK
jgi:general secretion pathway protein M